MILENTILSSTEIRAKIFLTILNKFQWSEPQRREAIREYLLVILPNINADAATRLAELVPALMPKLYEKWISAFVDRLLETIPDTQLQVLVSGGAENDAALCLVFLMFLESARMEAQMEADLREYAAAHGSNPDMGLSVAQYLRAKVAELAPRMPGAWCNSHAFRAADRPHFWA